MDRNIDRPTFPLPPNTLTNADGTPYSAGYDEQHCHICYKMGDQLCIVCERTVCQQCIAQGLQPGDSVICAECDKTTPNRKQAHDHYYLRVRLKNS